MSVKGTSKLAAVLQKRMKNVNTQSQGVYVEFGTITSGLGLKIDSIPNVNIRKSEYYVCQGVKYVANYIKNNVNEATNIETDILKVGDRVLVAWTYDGEAVVIDKIISANSL